MRLVTKIFGITARDLHPGHNSREFFLQKISAIRSGLGVEAIFAPKVAFTNQAVLLGDDSDVWSPDFIRTKESADGGLVTREKIAIGIFNADCPIICLYQDDLLAVLHAGYRCLIRKDSSEPNIIEVAMRHFNPAQTLAWVGYGIGPCCWVPGYEDKPEIKNPQHVKEKYRSVFDYSLKTTGIKSPFGPGNPTVDLYDLIKRMLVLEGVHGENIEVDGRCTCCAVEDGKLSFWSHTRFQKYGGADGRNLSLAFLDLQ